MHNCINYSGKIKRWGRNPEKCWISREMNSEDLTENILKKESGRGPVFPSFQDLGRGILKDRSYSRLYQEFL